MKQLTFLAVAMIMFANTFAQQALWGGETLVSPEINENNTVTFRFRAPKAVKVELIGDFLETPGPAPLKEGENGVWEYTTPNPLDSELYSYTFYVDGLRMNDP